MVPLVTANTRAIRTGSVRARLTRIALNICGAARLR